MPGLQVEELDDEQKDKDRREVRSMPGGLHVEELDEPAPADARPVGTGNPWLDGLLGLEGGLALGNARNLGKLGAGIATRVSDALLPSRVRDGMEPTYSGTRGAADALAEPVERAERTPQGALAHMVGTGVTALGTGGAAGPSVAGQAAAGAALGSAGAAAQSDADPLSMLAAMPAGGALGAAGGALAEHAAANKPMLDWLASGASKLGSQAVAGAGIGALLSGSRDPVDLMKAAGKGAVAAAGLKYAAGAMPTMLPAAIRGAGALGAPAIGSAFGGPSKAGAQDVAYGTAPTMAWAVQSVLASGGSGLQPADEQRLTEAVLSGDMDKLISANFALQQRNPAYAARLQRELESLQQED